MSHPLSRRGFLAAGAAAAGRAAQRQKLPNLLFIMPDQLRAAALGYLGNGDVQTPNLDRLATQSLVLPNTFANI